MYGVRSTAASYRPTVTTRLFLSLSSSGSGFGNKKNNSPPPENNYTPSSASSSSSSPPATNELFELQELRAQLQTILKQNIPFQSLSEEKREELAKYVFAIIDRTKSPINVSGRGDGNTMGIAKFVVGIENKSWRMVFTTANNKNIGASLLSSSSSLPTGATVILRVGEFLGMQGKLDYVLKYGERILGLNELVATSTCSVDVSVHQQVSARYTVCFVTLFVRLLAQRRRLPISQHSILSSAFSLDWSDQSRPSHLSVRRYQK